MDSRLGAVRDVCRRWLALYLPAATLVFVLSILVGFALGRAVPIESLPTADPAAGQGGVFPPLTTVDLAVNNLVAMVVLLFGAVSVGLVTIFGLVLNGLVVGAVVGIAVQTLSPVVILALLVPHGILEIPAFLIAAAVGLRFGRLTVRYVRGLEETLVTRRDLEEAGSLVAVSAVLIVVAAFIEANLTLEIAEWVAGGELSGV